MGARIWSLQIMQEPLVSAIGFILAGFAGLGVFPFLMWFREKRMVRMIGVLLLLGTALVWGITFYGSLWVHMASFAKWLPPMMAK